MKCKNCGENYTWCFCNKFEAEISKEMKERLMEAKIANLERKKRLEEKEFKTASDWQELHALQEMYSNRGRLNYHRTKKPQKKGCGKEYIVIDRPSERKCGIDGLCPSCSGNHTRLSVEHTEKRVPKTSAEKEPDVRVSKKNSVEASGSDFDLSEEIKDTKKEIERQKKYIKAGRREGKTYLVLLEQRLFYLEKFQNFIKKLKEDIDNPSGEVACSVAQIHRIIDKLVEEISGR